MTSESSRLTLIGAAILLAVLAVTGWWRASERGSELAAFRAQATAKIAELQKSETAAKQQLAENVTANGDLEALRGKLADTTSALNQRLQVLGERERQVAEIDRALDERKASINGLQQQLADAGKKLTGRLMNLGERERENADLDRLVADLQGRTSASQAELAQIQSKINQRLAVLGERERLLADYENKVRGAAYDLERLQQEAASLQPKVTEMKAELGQMDVQAAERKREADASLSRFVKAKAALEDLRRLVSE
jgi:chromosome segregation ATPase